MIAPPDTMKSHRREAGGNSPYCLSPKQAVAVPTINSSEQYIQARLTPRWLKRESGSGDIGGPKKKKNPTTDAINIMMVIRVKRITKIIPANVPTE